MSIQLLSGSGGATALNLPDQATRNVEPAVQVSAAVEAASAPKQGPSLEQVQQATSHVQQIVQAKASNLTFTVDQGSGKTVVKLMDSETGKVIRQIPSEEMIAMSEALDKMQGLLLKQKA